MTHEKIDTPRCEVVLEDWPPEQVAGVWADPSPDALRTLIDTLADFLTELVERPHDVALVVPLGYPQAVKRRDPSYTMGRGSGTVAARTMGRPDGGVDVILNSAFLIDCDANGYTASAAGGYRANPVAAKGFRFTIAHEAQHANMRLNGSGYDNYGGYQAISGDARRNYFGIAMQMCDEHRAQWNATQIIEISPPTIGDVLDVLCHMGGALATADARHLQSLRTPGDLWEFMTATYAATVPFWTKVAYWTAELRRGDEISELPEAITQLRIWQRYVGSTWHLIAEAFSQLPAAIETTPEALREGAKRVAAAVVASQQQIGFRHLDTPAAAFYIDRHDFPSMRE